MSQHQYAELGRKGKGKGNRTLQESKRDLVVQQFISRHKEYSETNMQQKAAAFISK
jgi:hypothetical protein